MHFLKILEFELFKGGGYNQGIAGIAEESQQPNKNEAFNEDIEELKEDSLVL